MVTITDDGVLFAKNSDRDPNEEQLLDWHPAARHEPGSMLRCTWIEIPQVDRTRAMLLSRPWWMWGAEIGSNDAGVTIGNEAVFTNTGYGDPALLGMDLVRLALERSDNAATAAATIIELLERHGQGGPCSHEHPGFTYHNSFLIADPAGAIVLETAGRQWATEVVSTGARSISNGLTIEPFASVHANRIKGRVAACATRRSITEAGAAMATRPVDLMNVLRNHGRSNQDIPTYSVAAGAIAAPCMHAGGLIAGSQTTASWVGDLRGAPLHWVTGTAAPCVSVFAPALVERPSAADTVGSNRFHESSRWWRHEMFHRHVHRNPGLLIPRVRPRLELLQAELLADPPTTDDAFDRIDALEVTLLDDIASFEVGDTRPWTVRAQWRRIDSAAALPSPSLHLQSGSIS